MAILRANVRFRGLCPGHCTSRQFFHNSFTFTGSNAGNVGHALTAATEQRTLLVAILLAIYYPTITELYTQYFHEIESAKPVQSTEKETLFTKSNLAQFEGESEDKPIYLSILGSVYDVTRGRKHYGKGCTYGFFSGRDASISFITGEFENYTEDSDDVLKLKPSDLLSLQNWKQFYDKEYIYKGKLIGRFFDQNGAKTDYHLKVDQMIRIAEEEKEEDARRKEEFPPCNIEWSESLGTKVWCSDQSGGKQRNWVGVPRKYYEPGKTSYRCACVRQQDLNSAHFKQYENCDPKSDTCFYRVD